MPGVYYHLSQGGEPGTVFGSMVIGGHVLPQDKINLCTVIDPNGHHLTLARHIYSVDKWGHITPQVTCNECGWSEIVNIDPGDD
jgi:hypothetical protein